VPHHRRPRVEHALLLEILTDEGVGTLIRRTDAWSAARGGTDDAPVWIFDLDNTLHDAVPHVFPHINRSMTAYLQAALGLDEAGAASCAALLAALRGDAARPDAPSPDRPAPLPRPRISSRSWRAWCCTEPQLRPCSRACPGRKFVFSNAPVHYCRAVLKALGVADLFDDVFSIEHTRFRPSPTPTASCVLLRGTTI
jgi:putative hydrolase of the HAD superfamily